MKHLLIILFALISFCSFGQTIIENFNDCKEDMFFVTAEEIPQFDNSGQDIYDYLNEVFKEKKLFKKVNGKVFIGILIFENGKPCCKSFSNMTGKEIDSKIIREIINNMPDWKPAIQGGKPVPFMYHLILNFEKGKIIKK